MSDVAAEHEVWACWLENNDPLIIEIIDVIASEPQTMRAENQEEADMFFVSTKLHGQCDSQGFDLFLTIWERL